MRTSVSICSQPMTVKCANCARFIAVGQRVVTTVMPGIVTTSHDVCPMPSTLAVHHIDGTRLNDDPDNLEVVDVREHLNWEGRTGREARIDARRRRGYDHA